MQTSLYKISFKNGSVFNVFCANKKQNKDMLALITHMNIHGKSKVKRKGIEVLARGIHTMPQFLKIIKN